MSCREKLARRALVHNSEEEKRLVTIKIGESVGCDIPGRVDTLI